MKQLIQDLKPWLPLIGMIAVVAVPLVLFGIKWRWLPPIFGYPLPLPIPMPA